MFRVTVLCLAALSLTAIVRADDRNKANHGFNSQSRTRELSPSLLIGKWVRTDKYVGTTMEYAKNGTYLTSAAYPNRPRMTPMPGTWKLVGIRLEQTLGPWKTKASVTIVRLTETEFRFVNDGGQEAVYKRVPEKK